MRSKTSAYSLLSVGLLAVSACQTTQAPPPKQAEPAPPAQSEPTKPPVTGLDRTVLPIRQPVRQTYTELDVRNVPMPQRFEVKAPERAPNVVVVLIDDMGFSASEAFGGAVPMPTLDQLANEGLKYNRFIRLRFAPRHEWRS